MNVKYSEHEIQSGKARIVLSVWQPSEPEAIIVFIPATMVHPLFYESLLSGFAERGFTVIGVHPVGHGKSPRNVKRYTIRDIVQNCRDAVSFAAERFSQPVFVMGTSQGGIVAAAAAAEDNRLKAVFAHNVMLSELPDSIYVSRFPKWLRYVYRPAQGIFKSFAFLFPDLSLPLKFYLEPSRISASPEVAEKVKADKLIITRYSLGFLASLFTTRFPGLTDGSIHCPIYVISDSGDKLFTESYTRQVFELLKAPHKEMVIFNFNDHMLMVTNPAEVCERLTGIIRKIVRH